MINPATVGAGPMGNPAEVADLEHTRRRIHQHILRLVFSVLIWEEEKG